MRINPQKQYLPKKKKEIQIKVQDFIISKILEDLQNN